MKTYWDLSDKERADLDQAGVERYIDAELMSKGVLKVEKLALEPVPDIGNEPTKRTYYELCEDFSSLGLVFSTSEDAEIVRRMRPAQIDHCCFNRDWSNRIPYLKPRKELTVRTVDLLDAQQFESVKANYERRAAIETLNKERQDAYTKASKAQNECLEGLWDDWARCRELNATHRKVVSTLESYTATAGGDQTVALRFLSKVYTDDQIVEACEWCGIGIVSTIPSSAPEEHAEAE